MFEWPQLAGKCKMLLLPLIGHFRLHITSTKNDNSSNDSTPSYFEFITKQYIDCHWFSHVEILYAWNYQRTCMQGH